MLANAAAVAASGGELTTGWVVLLVVGVLAVVGGTLLAVFWVALIGPARRDRRILAAGVPATAVVRAVRSTGTRIGGRTVVRLDLEVTDALGRVAQASCRTLHDPAVDERFVPGERIAVKIDPGDPSRVALERRQPSS